MTDEQRETCPKCGAKLTKTDIRRGVCSHCGELLERQAKTTMPESFVLAFVRTEGTP